jgi:hypothetical protein
MYFLGRKQCNQLKKNVLGFEMGLVKKNAMSCTQLTGSGREGLGFPLTTYLKVRLQSAGLSFEGGGRGKSPPTVCPPGLGCIVNMMI